MTLTTGLVPVAGGGELGHDHGLAVRRAPARRRLAAVLLVLDAVAATLAATTALLLDPIWAPQWYLVVVVGWPVAVGVAGGYSAQLADPGALRPGPLVTAAGEVALGTWVAVAVAPPGAWHATNRELATTALLLVVLLTLLSATARAAVATAAARRPTPVVLVGSEEDVRALLREAERAGGARRFTPVAACLSDRTELAPDEPAWPVTARCGVGEHLLDAVRSHGAGGVVVVPGPGIGHPELRRWAAWLQDEGVELMLSSGLRDVSPRRLGTATLGGARLLLLAPARLDGPARLAKGVFDRLAALGLLVAFAPLLAGLLLVVRLDSPGPAVYRQLRVGKDGRLFTVYKLRTMCVDAHLVRHQLSDANESDRAGALFKIRQDPRVTRAGAVLRRYSLDELPQLVNVLRGQMSLVGPRPALPEEVAAYHTDLHRRLAVKPGLTGLWQVSGRSELSWEETVRLDLQYVDDWSWPLDLRILFRTAGAVLGHRGAY